jgi:hypothetical protein
MTSVIVNSNFIIITNEENYELTIVINLNEICTMNFIETKNKVRDFVFRLRDGSEKVIPFEDEESARAFVGKLVECLSFIS